MMAAPPVSPEVIELLGSLGDYKVGLVTSSGRVEVEEILNRAGIRHHFHTAVFGGDVKRLKPAPDPYLLAVERLGVTNALVVEDSEAGCASATAAGLDVLRVRNQAEMPALLAARLSTAAMAATPRPASTSTR
jgi:HAD superfamily hydrolase (TIGR01509 family)